MCGPETRARGLSRGRRRHHFRQLQRGLSLIELMVGLVVALLVVLAAIGSAQFFMGRQRAAIAVGSPAGNATNALAAIKYEAAQAGLGFFADGRLLCGTMNLSQGATVFATGSALAPLQLTQDGAGLVIDVLHGSALEAVSPAPLAAPVGGADASLAVGSYLPVAAGQTVMLVPGAGSTAPCTVRTATAVTPAGDGTPLTVTTGAEGAANQAAFPPVAYATGDFVSQLGTLEWARFSLDHGSLVMTRPLAGTSAVMVRNVVAFAAGYGLADAGASAVTVWQPPTGDWATLAPARMAGVRALRVGLVVRSEQPEKKTAAGRCSASTALPVLFGTPVAFADPDWACYRYRVDSIVVPLRNIVMGSGA